MPATELQKPNCPVCHKPDQVQKILGAYESGVDRLAPPPMPGKQISMMSSMMVGIGVVGVAVFFIIVVLGSDSVSWLQVFLTFACILTALILSFISFQKVVRGDLETQGQLPAWDKAMATYRHLCYCRRDDIVFDPTQNKVVSGEALHALQNYQERPAAPTTGATPTLAQKA